VIDPLLTPEIRGQKSEVIKMPEFRGQNLKGQKKQKNKNGKNTTRTI
jgi:hypothetical protein